MEDRPPVTDASAGATAEDPLAEIDRLMQKRSEEEQETADQSARLDAKRSEFSTEFASVCEQQVRPSMEAILERLRSNGGGGVIEERPEDTSHTHRLTLWMSLSGEIIGTPREDRHPYFQLDADVDKGSVTVSEGDMWQGHGGNRSGKVAEWQLSDITSSRVTQDVLAVLRRSVQ